MTRFFNKPIGSYLCACGEKATTHGYCDKHWESEGKKKLLDEAKKVQKELNQIHAEEMKSEIENDLYYKKARCV